MRYAAIRSFDVTNGEGAGISLFVQGCPFHCYQCFNPETWDYNSGKLWTPETEEKFLALAGRDYIKRISFLGGSPLCDENVYDVLMLIKKLKRKYPEKQIWVYTGYTWENINSRVSLDELNSSVNDGYRKLALEYIDVLIDGQFEYDKKDLTLVFRGSTNQRIIDVQKSINSGRLILWKDGNYR